VTTPAVESLEQQGLSQREKAALLLLAVAAYHQQQQQGTRLAFLRRILDIFSQMPSRDMSRWWISTGMPQMKTLLTIAQRTVASDASLYVQRAFEVQGVKLDVPRVNAEVLSGWTSEGLDLDGELLGALVRVKVSILQGFTVDAAQQRGAAVLTRIVSTEISDAARAADQIALVAAGPVPTARRASAAERREAGSSVEDKSGQKFVYGWVRMLQPPSCARCIVLAGAFYKWNQGFERHPLCDCKHVPAVEAIAGDVTVDSKAYFNSLTEREQNEIFGKANSAAIRDGASITQVLNATTRKGALYVAGSGRRYTREGSTRLKMPRPTPMQIYRDARGDREAAIRMLRKFRYIL
jgi:hypothetical protein